MQKILITTFLLLQLTGVKAQQLSNQIVGAFGMSSTNGVIMLEDHIGSISVSTIATPTFIYTQGFLQPDAGTTTVVPPINDVVLSSGAGIDNAGTTFINGGIMLEFAVGEIANLTHTNSESMLTQGILQPYIPTYIWFGTVDTNWSNTMNWSSNIVPTQFDDVVVPGGRPRYPIIANLAECKSIILLTGSTATIDTAGLLKIYE